MPNIYSLPQEVIVHVCSYILVRHPVSTVGWQRDEKTLARLARTSKTLSGPALTVLWRTLPNILPLLFTLPADLCVRRVFHVGRGQPEQYMEFARLPTAADFSRWILYSVLVRDIKNLHKTSAPPSITVSLDVWDVLAHHGPKSLIPCVHALNTHDIGGKRYPLGVTRLLFSSTLTNYRLAMANPDADLVPHVDALAECSPVLKTLRVSWDYSSRECVGPVDHRPSTSLSQRFTAFAYLRELSVVGIQILPPALQSMGALPSLQTLDITVSSVDYPASWTTSTPNPDTGHFPQLCTLRVQVDDLSWVAATLRHICSPVLEQIQITSSHSRHDSFERLCEVLSRHRSREALRYISHEGWLGHPCDLNAAFTYLLALPAITDVSLDTSSIVMLSDATLEAMSRAWPRLENLDLHSYQYDPDAAFEDYFSSAGCQATLDGLSALAHNCPSLEVLNLAIDPRCKALLSKTCITDTPAWHQAFRPVAPNRSALTRLYVGFIDTEYPMEVAGVISALFPHLDYVDHGDNDEGMYSFPGWTEANRVLRE
ncbi:hypothetical protein OH76DRAFT_215542 [Lentinus brumalis]|uniref:F-box domain-containing protein n=1 Tax=Lentinus brumalis TaxID=2498619 RepID=A0A371CME5_9APHY|nr:hypothetical protein OH76DRAFT_215542 [Polyporus brumalis]